MPQFVERHLPIYPSELIKQGVVGTAEVEFVLDTQGAITQVSVVEATNEAFGQAAVECIRKWKITPGIKGGRAIEVRLRQSFSFNPPEQKRG